MPSSHVATTVGTFDGPPGPGEFVVRVRGVGEVTVTPGRDAPWDHVLAALRELAPSGAARRYHQARILYYRERQAGAGRYPDGALLHWGA